MGKKLKPIFPKGLTLMENQLTKTITIMLGNFLIWQSQWGRKPSFWLLADGVKQWTMVQNNHLLLCTKSVAQELAHTGNSQWVYEMSGENFTSSKFPKRVCVCSTLYKWQYILHKVVTGLRLPSVSYLTIGNTTGTFNDLAEDKLSNVS